MALFRYERPPSRAEIRSSRAWHLGFYYRLVRPICAFTKYRRSVKFGRRFRSDAVISRPATHTQKLSLRNTPMGLSIILCFGRKTSGLCQTYSLMTIGNFLLFTNSSGNTKTLPNTYLNSIFPALPMIRSHPQLSFPTCHSSRQRSTLAEHIHKCAAPCLRRGLTSTWHSKPSRL